MDGSKMEEWEDGVRDWWAAGRLKWEETDWCYRRLCSTYSPVSILSSIVQFLSQNVYPTPFPFTFPRALNTGAPSTALPCHSHPYCNDSLFLLPSRRPHIFFILFCPYLSSALPSAAPGCGECLTFGGWQASVCVSEISQLKSQIWQIIAAIQKWTVERRNNYEWEVMRSSRERTLRGAFRNILVCVYACNMLCA